MLKHINKKNLPLLFVIAALTQFGSTNPMLEKDSDPCEQPSTKITDIPFDCFGEIFQFLENYDKLQVALALSSDKNPMIKIFPQEIEIDIESSNKKYTHFLNLPLEKLLKKENSLKISLFLPYDSSESYYPQILKAFSKILTIKWESNGITELDIHTKPNTHRKEFKFDFEKLKNFSNLRSLRVSRQKNFTLDVLNEAKLKCLQKLCVEHCDSFARPEFENLKELCEAKKCV